MRRPSRGGVVGLACIAVVVAAVVVVLVDPFGGGTASGGLVDNSFPTGVQKIVRRSLSQQTEVSATLGYADPSTVAVPPGTAPSDVTQAQESVTSAQGMLASDESTLSADAEALAELRSSLAAARGKESVDCRGDDAAESAPSGSTGNGDSGSGGGSGPCADDEQTVSGDEQSLAQDTSKVSADQTKVSSDQASLSSAQSALSAADSSGAVYGQSSAFTALPALGAILDRGQSLYSIGGQPVVLLYGSVAAWRAFVPGMSPGGDVAELNANLSALGYGAGLTGNEFTSATASAIDSLQAAHGETQTGQLLLGSVVFEAGPVRVTSVTPTLGAPVQAGPVLGITSTVREVTIELDADQQSDVAVGDPVSITLPNNSTTPGRISYVGTVATEPSSADDQGGGSDTPTIEVDVKPTDPAATGRLDQAPVNVSITTGSVKNVLVVPVDALLALSGGGYALEEIEAGGAHSLAGVSLGLFDDEDGLVQVSGSGIVAGQRVVVPAE